MNESYNEMADAWKDGLPQSFGFLRKTKAYGRTYLNFVSYLFIITGAWNIFDTCFWESTPQRDIIFFVIGILGSFLCNDILAPESIYYITSTRGRHHQQYQYKTNPEADPFLDHCLCNSHPWVPNEDIDTVQDEFVRDVIHPIVKEFISPGEVYVIEIWNYINAVILVPFFDLFQWIGLWNLIDYHYNGIEDPFTKTIVFLAVGYAILTFSFTFDRLFGGSDMEDSWKLGIPRSFGWRRKSKNFIRSCVAFIGFMFTWVGASNNWDSTQEDVTVYVAYFLGATFAMYLGTEIFSIDGLFYWVTIITIKLRQMMGLTEDEDPASYILDEDI